MHMQLIVFCMNVNAHDPTESVIFRWGMHVAAGLFACSNMHVQLIVLHDGTCARSYPISNSVEGKVGESGSQ